MSIDDSYLDHEDDFLDHSIPTVHVHTNTYSEDEFGEILNNIIEERGCSVVTVTR